MSRTKSKTANRLINEKSPYLLQHAYNPVDWYPWGEEAFARAKAEDKPVFLSIGYSSCHWCHVMEKESFADPGVAALLNEHFIPVKVDREERPDLDHIYMTACQALTGQGGWPLTVFLTPDKKPFFAGTYFPKHSRYGIAGLMELLPKLAALWAKDREKAAQAGAELLGLVLRQGRAGGGAALPGEETLELAYRRLKDSFDEVHGGFGGAPKFPVPHQLFFLLRYWKRSGESRALEMVVQTLKAMARGGIFDQIGYGFHRYSTDASWLVPHFEKMLYDQALMALAYLEAYQATGEAEFAATARQVFEYLLRDMITPEKAFCAAEDADSKGKEGLFYVWMPAELNAALGGERGSLVAEYYGVTEQGNFEDGRSILHCRETREQFARRKNMDPALVKEILEESRERLYQVRSSRERPFKDDKIITAWNGLVIAALARGAAVLEAPLYAQVAAGAAAFIEKRMTELDGRLGRRYRDGVTTYPAFLDDYAFLAWGLLELYQATFLVEHLRRAVTLTEQMLDLFGGEGGALNYVPAGLTDGLPQYQEAYDGATPSGNSVAAINLLRLGRLTGRTHWEEKGEAIVRAFSAELQSSPTGFTHMLTALDYILGPAGEVIITGDTGSTGVEKLAAAVRKSFAPNTLLLFHPAGIERLDIEALIPYLENMPSPDSRAAAYLCRNRSCLLPQHTPEGLTALLREHMLQATLP